MNLTWIRIFDPVHIPKKYVDQIKCKDFDYDRFCAYQQSVCLIKDNDKIYTNPTNILYVLCNDEKIVKGFCWLVVDELTNSLVIQNYSVDKEYWKLKDCVEALKEKVLDIKRGAQLDKVYWITRSVKHSEKFGFKRSKHTLMEYSEDGKSSDGEQAESSRSSSSHVTRTDELLESTINRDGGSSTEYISESS